MKYEPMRMCIACRKRRPKEELLRLRFSGDDVQVVSSNEHGFRSYYICKSEECIALASKKKVFNRIAKKEVNASIYEKLKGYCCDKN